MVLVSNLIYTQNELPVNSTDKTSVNKWIIAKVNDSIDTKKIIKSLDYFGSIDKNQIKSLNLSKFNNVTFSLYQNFEDINFNNTFIIASSIESKTDYKYSFVYNNFDMVSEIYINGEKAIVPDGLWNLKFEHLLKRGGIVLLSLENQMEATNQVLV